MVELQRNSSERSWAAFAHLAAFSSVVVPFGNILGPLIIWLAKRSESELVERHARESLNFQISIFIYSFVFVIGFLISIFSNIEALNQLDNAEPLEVFSVIGRFFTWLIPLVFLALFNFIVVIVAAFRAGDGNDFRYPISIRFIN